MARRKQAAPQARRLAKQTEEVESVSVPDTAVSELNEYQVQDETPHALHPLDEGDGSDYDRPSKRICTGLAETASSFSVLANTEVLYFYECSCFAESDHSCPDVLQFSLDLHTQQVLVFSEVETSSDRQSTTDVPWVCLQAPSVAAAKSLLALLKSGHLAACISPAHDSNSVLQQSAGTATHQPACCSQTGSHQQHTGLTGCASTPGLQHCRASTAWPATRVLSGGSKVTFKLGLSPQALTTSSPTSPEDMRRRWWQEELLQVLHWLMPQGMTEVPSCTAASNEQGRINAADVYKAVKPSNSSPEFTGEPAELRPRLRPYQRRAVAWMLSRENMPVAVAECQQQTDDNCLCLEPNYRPTIGSAGDSVLSSKDSLYETDKSVHKALDQPTGTVCCRHREESHQHICLDESMQTTTQTLKINIAGAHAGSSHSTGTTSLHPLWREVSMPDGRSFYLNPFTGLLSSTAFHAPAAVRGGVLCDEMGLGKTVELLACIVSHRFQPPPGTTGNKQPPDSPASREERIDCCCGAYSADPTDAGDYTGLWVCCDTCSAWMHGQCVGLKREPQGGFVCSRCLREQASQQVAEDCGATLIVCPTPILDQWYEEIQRHIRPGTLKVVVYNGQMQAVTGAVTSPAASVRTKVVTAAELASADIVLTTYDVLKRDLGRQPELEAHERTLRRKKRYTVIPTPLTRLRWWRVCLDEAQMVESSTAKATEMALKLEAVHRWCVTGTPISRGLEDVFGLMAFLQAAPWAERFWWNRVIQRPCEAHQAAGWRQLMALLRPAEGGLMWRTAKADVAGELGLPSQHAHLNMLQLSAVERHFYNRQHQDCASKARSVLPPGMLSDMAALQHSDETSDRPLEERELTKILQPLLRLRQACCHPQVGGGGIRAGSAHTGAPMSMDEILGVLVAKAKQEAEEAQRQVIAALNGLAGLLLIEGKPADAVSCYRQVLQVIETNKELIEADPLQRLHTCHNLCQLLGPDGQGVPGVARTLRDSNLASEADGIRMQYLKQRRLVMEAAEGDYLQHLSSASPLTDNAVDHWYMSALDLLVVAGQGEQVTSLLKDRLIERLTSENASSIAHRFSTVAGLKLVLSEHLTALAQQRSLALNKLNELRQDCHHPSKALVEKASGCQRCRSEMGIRGPVCDHCDLDELFINWEVRLFKVYTQALTAGDIITTEEAARKAQQAALRWARHGVGVNPEYTLLGAEPEDGARRSDAAFVASQKVIWQPSEAEQVLQMLVPQIRRLPASVQRDSVLEAAQQHLQRMEAQRKMFGTARALTTAQRMYLYIHDELEMAVMRMRLRVQGEEVRGPESNFKLHLEEVPVKSCDLTAERLSAETELQRTLGTLRYLHSLRAARSRAAAGSSSEAAAALAEADACPVCHDAIKSECVMLPCGHQVCCDCSDKMVEMLPAHISASHRRITCPTCRTRVHVSEVAFVDSGRSVATCSSTEHQWADEVNLSVRGSHSTKIDAVVRRIMYVLQQDASARVLVFSSWTEVLELVGHALAENKQPYRYAKGKDGFKKSLLQFRAGCTILPAATQAEATGAPTTPATAGNAEADTTTPATQPCSTSYHPATSMSVPRVLLLLTSQGGAGLNLTEAQHVVLVEPLLDPAVEAQVVGRVHRIGQARETHVHRFVVKHTVEENVHALGSKRQAGMDLAAASPQKRNRSGLAASHGSLTVRDVAWLISTKWE